MILIIGFQRCQSRKEVEVAILQKGIMTSNLAISKLAIGSDSCKYEKPPFWRGWGGSRVGVQTVDYIP
jgi:hypothetical protein